MTQTHRFGRRIALPSTVQIVHELLVFSAQEDARRRQLEGASSPTTAATAEIGRARLEKSAQAPIAPM
jgi:hypothetical protein